LARKSGEADGGLKGGWKGREGKWRREGVGCPPIIILLTLLHSLLNCLVELLLGPGDVQVTCSIEL